MDPIDQLVGRYNPDHWPAWPLRRHGVPSLALEAVRPMDLIVAVGAPGCGKTWGAERWAAEAPYTRALASKDDSRATLGVWGSRDDNPPDVERRVWAHELRVVRDALGDGRDVIVADTCQTQDAMDQWVRVAEEFGARLVVWDYRDVPLGLCVERDRKRGASGGRLVGEAAIRRVAGRCAGVVVPAGVVVRVMG